MDEATALLVTLGSTAPDALTACAGWTTHDLVAHLAAGAAEMATHAERTLAGKPDLPTRGFAEREAPFVALADDELRARLLSEALRLNSAVEALAESGLSFTFSGRRLSAVEMQMHGRSEAVLHRWDIVGDDDTGQELLSQPEMTEHAVTVLNSMLSGSSESPAARANAAGIEVSARLVFGAPGQPDVVLLTEGGVRFELADPSPSPTVTADAATRLLALWGRRSSDRTMTWHADEPVARQFGTLLWRFSAWSPPASIR
jgi:uncharacterized protein (TIGR03083 family)